MKIRIASAQINPVVGDISGNKRLIERAIQDSLAHGAQVVVFPEMAMTGYPVEDLALRPAFRRASIQAVNEIAIAAEKSGAGEMVIVLGYPTMIMPLLVPKHKFNI